MLKGRLGGLSTVFLNWLGLSVLFMAPSALARTHYVSPLEGRSGVGERVSDFSFQDTDGRRYRLSEVARQNRALVFILHQKDCPLSKKYGPVLARYGKEFARTTQLFIVPVGGSTSKAELAALKKRYGWSMPVLWDPEERVARALNVRSTTETFVLDRTQTLRYRGPVDDQFGVLGSLPEARRHYLREAVSAVLGGREVKSSALVAPGCALDYERKPATTHETFHNRISRILQKKCQSCHRDSGAAPFPLVTYQQVKSHLPMIEWMVSEGYMPPWYANKRHGEWKNDMRLSDYDKASLLSWVRGGAPEGDIQEAPLPMRWQNEWSIGVPDLILETESFSVPATGEIPYINHFLDVNLPEDRWVKAIQILPQDPQVVHHAMMVYALKGESEEILPGLESCFANYVPGMDRAVYADDQGRFLPRRTRFLLQTHYTSVGSIVKTKLRVGLVFHEEPPQFEVMCGKCESRSFKIPPHENHVPVRAVTRIKETTPIISLHPHMHTRGKSMRMSLRTPNGTRQVLLDIPQYNFYWQIKYEPRKTIVAPKGSELVCEGVYDNSAKNPYNPNPRQTVGFGLKSTDEMFIGYFEYLMAVSRRLSTAARYPAFSSRK